MARDDGQRRIFLGTNRWPALPYPPKRCAPLIAESAKDQLVVVRPERRQALLAHLMIETDAMTPNGGDTVTFVADRQRP